jgi:hypothetical protein
LSAPWCLLDVKHIAYPCTTSTNIKALEMATRELVALKEDAKTKITNAERGNGAATKQTEEWLRQVNTIEKDAEEIHEKYSQMCRCILNISPNLWSSYKISRNIAKKLVEMKILNHKKATIRVIA